jgi:hypothetical protein
VAFFSGERVGGVPFFSAREKKYFDFCYLGALLGPKGAETLKNRSKHPLKVVLRRLKLLKAIFHDVIDFLSIFCRFWLIFYLVRDFLKG